MRGEFIGVWSETHREIWGPLFEVPVGEEEAVLQDIYCELYRELAKAKREPTGSVAVDLLLEDAIALREIFEGAAQRASQDLALESVKEAFTQSRAAEAVVADERRTRVEAALLGLLGRPGVLSLELELQDQARDAAKVEAAWSRAIEKTISDPRASREAFEATSADDLKGERVLVGFFESIHASLEEFEESGDDALTNRYFNLLAAFIEKFSLRYDLRRPCFLCPTLPGVFASLMRDLRTLTSADAHLDGLMKDFENAVRDLRQDCSESRIKTCIQKQVNLLEAIGRACPGVTATTLGAICEQLGTWPHEKLKVAMKSLYVFASDYPGIRHGGTAASALRAVDMRDMVAISILLAGFTPYMSEALNSDRVYRGA